MALEAARTGRVEKPFDYHGVTPGREDAPVPQGLPPIKREEATGLVEVEQDPATGKLKVKLKPPREMTRRPHRIAPGHGACPGCGIFPALNQFFMALEGDIVVLFQTGCGYVVTTGYPYTSHRVTFIHNLFQNGAATLSGLVEMFHEKKRRGEIQVSDDFTFVMVTGDGGMDIGMGPAIGTALRNHGMIIVEDDKRTRQPAAYFDAARPHKTSTSVPGTTATARRSTKDTAQIMAATNIPYVFTATEAFPQDLMRKAAKAQWYAKNEGMAYGKLLITCPLNWGSIEAKGQEILEKAVNCCFFPLYEVEKGITNITYNPEDRQKRYRLSSG